MPDIKGDSKRGVQTIPNTFGFNVSKVVVVLLCTTSLLFTTFLINKVIALIIAFWAIFATLEDKKSYYFWGLYLIILAVGIYFTASGMML